MVSGARRLFATVALWAAMPLAQTIPVASASEADELRPSCAYHSTPESPVAAVEGFFVQTGTKSRLFFVGGHRQRCLVQHEDGARSDVLTGDYNTFIGVCRDPVTDLDWALAYSASGAYGDLRFVSVDPDTRTIRVEFEQAWAEWDGSDYGQLVEGGICLARAMREAKRTFEAAMSALQPKHEEHRDRARFQNGDAFELFPVRRHATDVRQWLLALESTRPAVATFEGAHYADEPSRQAWTVVQVLGIGYEPGLVLVLERARNEWHAIYGVQAGASKAWNYPIRHMLVDGDSLYATMCTYCLYWGDYADFRIELRTHRVFRLSNADWLAVTKDDRRRLLWTEERRGWVDNPVIEDIQAVIGTSATGDATQ